MLLPMLTLETGRSRSLLPQGGTALVPFVVSVCATVGLLAGCPACVGRSCLNRRLSNPARGAEQRCRPMPLLPTVK